MTSSESHNQVTRSNSTRRQFLIGGAAAGAGVAATLGVNYVLTERDKTPASLPLNGINTVPFFGVHQAGIDTDAQAHAVFIGFDLRDEVDRDGLRRLMTILSDDAARLTQGEPPLADSEPELAVHPARLTVTFGFGPKFIERAQGTPPSWLQQLPAFGIDQLQPEFSEGDLLIQIASDDPITVSHAARMLTKDARSFATVRWTQPGFRRAHGTVKPGTTMRNLFGQVDGTSNPEPGTSDFDGVVWNTSGWMTHGTTAVIRRIHMDLDTWDRVNRSGRDQSVGRFQSNGAPLTSSPHGAQAEFDEPDFEAKTGAGFTVIPSFSHIVRARTENPAERIFRRAYNYEDSSTRGGAPEAGLIFTSFQADVEAQFVPIQRRLDELDLLNEWTTPIGSSVFAIPPGCQQGGFIGDTLLS